jgi:hypothetical protein
LTKYLFETILGMKCWEGVREQDIMKNKEANMSKKYLWSIIFSLCILVFINFTGCNKREKEPTPTQVIIKNLPFIMGNITNRPYWNRSDASCWITGDPVPEVDSVLVNNIKLTASLPGQGGLYYDIDSIGVYPCSTYKLTVYHSGGKANASVTIPNEDIQVIYPDTNVYTIPRDSSDFVITWHSVENASYYLLTYHISCSWNGGGHGHGSGTSVYDTTYTISASDLLYLEADTTDTLTGWSGEIYIGPAVGPIAQPGDSGNIEGEGCGFWWGGCEDSTKCLELRLEGVGKAKNSNYGNTTVDKKSNKDLLMELRKRVGR